MLRAQPAGRPCCCHLPDLFVAAYSLYIGLQFLLVITIIQRSCSVAFLCNYFAAVIFVLVLLPALIFAFRKSTPSRFWGDYHYNNFIHELHVLEVLLLMVFQDTIMSILLMINFEWLNIFIVATTLTKLYLATGMTYLVYKSNQFVEQAENPSAVHHLNPLLLISIGPVNLVPPTPPPSPDRAL